ncbi:MAG: hypothetical protein Q4D65_08090 [Peptostreptococcaceae bacterium]|nr:hypothetical protein [Peptostreptococcaceae bacterium]
MYRLQKDNIIKETTDELKKDELILKGFELLGEKSKGGKTNAAPSSTDEIISPGESTEHDAQESTDETPKSGKGAKKNAK